LAQDEDLSAEAQSQLLDWALARGANDIVSLLLQREDLDSIVDARIGDVDDYRIKAAWLQRRGRTLTQIEEVLKREKRQTVLAALVQSDGLPDAVYATCTERISGVKALVALVSGPAPERYRVIGARKLAGHRSELGWRALSQVAEACAGSTKIRRELLVHSRSRALVGAALKHASVEELDSTSRSNIVDVLLMTPLNESLAWLKQWKTQVRSNTTSRVAYGSPAYTITSHLSECGRVLTSIGAGAELRDRVASVFEKFDSMIGDTALLGNGWNSQPMVPTGSLVLGAEELRNGLGADMAQLGDLAERLIDPMNCHGAISELAKMRSRATGSDLARRLALQAVGSTTSVEVISALLDLMPELWSNVVACAGVGHTEMAHELLRRAPGGRGVRTVLEHFQDSDGLLRWWLSEVRPDATSCCQVLDDGTYELAGDDIDLLPGALVWYSTAFEERTKILALAGRRCFERYGTDAEAWRLIEQLGRGFHGTLGELFTLVDLSLDR
jgi:hypothetical protein